MICACTYMYNACMSWQVTGYSDPMVDALTALTDKRNGDYFYQDDALSKPVYGQYIPIPGETGRRKRRRRVC